MPHQDSDTAVTTQAENGYFDDVRDGNHLTVVYDGFAKQVRFFVNGDLEEVACQNDDGDSTADDPECTDPVPWAVPERQLGADRATFAPEDRALPAALLVPLPRQVLHRLRLLVQPDTVRRRDRLDGAIHIRGLHSRNYP